MNRLNRAVLALGVCGGLLVAVPVFAGQAKPAQPPAQAQKPNAPVKFITPVRGIAEIQYLAPKTERKGKEVITTITVKNVSNAPIALLKCTETWYDKARGLVPGGDEQRVRQPMQVGEVVTITLRDVFDPRMDTNQYQFSHANGTVKAKRVNKF